MNGIEKWAERRLLVEIENGFQNGLKLTWFLSRLSILSFLDLSEAEQRQLVKILPSGARFSGAHFDAVRRAISDADLAVIAKLNDRMGKRQDWGNPGEARDHALRAFGAQRRKEWRPIAKSVAAELKKCARQRGYKISVSEPAVFDVSIRRGECSYSIEFDVLQPFVIKYVLKKFSLNHSYSLFPMGYLEALGLGPSGWVCPSLEAIPQVTRDAVDFCEWHIMEMAGLDDSIKVTGSMLPHWSRRQSPVVAAPAA